METTKEQFPWLELMDRPAFCVKGNAIVACNEAAKGRTIQVGTDLQEILGQHADDYQNFHGGCLYLTVNISGIPCSASVTRTEDCDIFVLEQDTDAQQLQVLALAAQQLRMPLSNILSVTDRLFQEIETANAQQEQQIQQVNRGLLQLLRIITNMSDSEAYCCESFTGKQNSNLSIIFREVIEKVQAVSEKAGVTLLYTEPDAPILGLADPDKLERAVYNLLSNALKFSAAGSTIEAKLTRTGNQLSFCVCNTDATPVQAHAFWSRYRREPGIEDNRHGLGLGMTLISAVAAAHSGTVLIDHPSDHTTRVTMTIRIVTDDSGNVRSPIMRIGDYAGGRDKALMEFSDFLPTDAYKNI